MANEKKKSSLVKNIICLVIIIGAGIFVWSKYQESRRNVRENAAVELMNGGNYLGALPAFEDLYSSAPKKDLVRLGDYIAQCHVELAMAPDASGDDSMKHFQEAMKYNSEKVPAAYRKKFEKK